MYLETVEIKKDKTCYYVTVYTRYDDDGKYLTVTLFLV